MIRAALRGLVLVLAFGPGGVSAEPVAGAMAALNALRAQAGLAPVAQAPGPQRAAEAHGADMARRGFFAHQGSDGSAPGDRLRAAGYRYCFAAENIAKGQQSLEAVMRGWASSPGHARNMLDPRAREAGLARLPGNIWVMVLAAPGC